jgi:hypothetical protein
MTMAQNDWFPRDDPFGDNRRAPEIAAFCSEVTAVDGVRGG